MGVQKSGVAAAAAAAADLVSISFARPGAQALVGAWVAGHARVPVVTRRAPHRVHPRHAEEAEHAALQGTGGGQAGDPLAMNSSFGVLRKSVHVLVCIFFILYVCACA
jgi:hypothetical protein